MSSQVKYIYGINSVQMALENNANFMQQIYVSQKSSRIQNLVKLAHQLKIPVEHVERAKLTSLINANHQGVVAICQNKELDLSLDQLLQQSAQPPLLLILDQVQDPHNLGACLRSAAAAGVTAVIVPKRRSAAVTATVSKVACGAAEIVPVIQVNNLAQCLKSLKQQGVWLYGLAMDGVNSLYDLDLTVASGLILGSESTGLRNLTKSSCDELAAIPMHAAMPSLNVSVAAGIALFEAVRQRRI